MRRETAAAAGDEALHFSASQLKTYIGCPEAYRQRYVRRATPSHRSAEMVLGSAIHAGLAVFHRAIRDGRPPRIDDVISEFDALFDVAASGPIPIQFEDEESATELRTKGRELLRMYIEGARIHRVLAVEQPFVMPLVDPRTGEIAQETVTGYIDLIEEDEDGSVVVTEIKTGAKKLDQLRLWHDPQVSLYAAARAVLGYPHAKLRFRTLIRTKQPKIDQTDVPRDEKTIREVLLTSWEVLRAIDARIFFPIRGWQCARCPFRATCGDG